MTSSLVAPLYIEKIGEKVLHRQPQAVCSGFSDSDGSAEWLIQIRTRWSLIEVERPYSCRDRAQWRQIRRHERARKRRQRALERSRGHSRGLLRVYLLEKSLVEAQKCCFPHYFPNVSIVATFAVNLCPKVSIAVPTVPLSRKSCPALLVSLSSSLMSTNPSSRCNISVTVQRIDFNHNHRVPIHANHSAKPSK